MDIYACFRPCLMALDPERAHRLTLFLLKAGCGPVQMAEYPSLKIKLWNREFPNPLGLAAGFDKDAEVLQPMLDMGFGFVEAGTVTPRPQPGNPRPRIFRDKAGGSVINSLGFPGKGLENFAENVRVFRAKNKSGIVGINIGINKGAASPVADYQEGLAALSPLADYIVVNVSSPNTAGLRNLQVRSELDGLLGALKASVPLFLKVAPDLDAGQKADIAELALTHGLGGLIVSNTTLSRPAALPGRLKNQVGGLSGALLKPLALETLADFYQLTSGRLPLIGAGGISSAEDAYERIKAGASLVQLYTGLVFEGPQLIPRILEGLAENLARDGFSSIKEAVGSGQRNVKRVI